MQLTDRLTAKVSSDILTKARLNKGKTWLWAIFRLFLFIGIGYVILYPILYMLSTTFRSDADILDPSIVWDPQAFLPEQHQAGLRRDGVSQGAGQHGGDQHGGGPAPGGGHLGGGLRLRRYKFRGLQPAVRRCCSPSSCRPRPP